MERFDSALPRLDAVAHWRIEPAFGADAHDWLARAERAGALAGAQLRKLASKSGFEPEAVLALSTIIDSTVTSSAEAVRRFCTAIEAGCGQAPQGILSAYLCAGWGFALRHLLRNTSITRAALLIVDLDLHDMEWQLEHPLTGLSGFGVTTLLFSLPEDRRALPECSGPHPNSAYNEFVMALRRHETRAGTMPAFIPFTRSDLYRSALGALADGSLAPNRHDVWGHCFGADPWIGLIEWLARPADAAARAPSVSRILAGAIAMNGYYTLCAISLDERIVSEFQRFDGSFAALDEALRRGLIPGSPSRGSTQHAPDTSLLRREVTTS